MNDQSGFGAPSAREAFAAGLWRGMAGPWAIYSQFELPAYARPQYMPVANPLTASGGLAEDWRRVGGHLRAAMARIPRTHG
jgi:muconolactone delta-isomerase